MADQIDNTKPEGVKILKSTHALREEKILARWKEKGIFEKSLNKWPAGKAPKGEFVFYEGPPTANGHPGIHHLEARAFKDAIPRYKTMRGYHVRRKGGWDTHGLPVELQVEKELGLKSKKEIDSYGIGAFNDKCKESVWRYVNEWTEFTERIGYWADLKDPYITYKPKYIEAVWNVIKTADEKELLYKDYKVVPWCPRCGTALSSHELAQGYQTVKDLSLTVKFKIPNPKSETNPKSKIQNQTSPTYLLAWTTTPWTLPGNVGLAVNPKIDYVKVRSAEETYIVAKDRYEVIKGQFTEPEIVETIKGSALVGVEYEPLYPFLKDHISGAEKEKLGNAYKVYAADFVTTSDGTGIVHTAVMYGQDDFELGTKVGLPKYHLVHEDGTFKKEAGFLAGAFVKDPNTDVTIIRDLAGRGLLFAKEKYEHTYPFCWRCHTPLIYFARDSWYIRMSELRKKLVKENESIHWEPDHTKEGRFGEWLREVKDWAISRERYWGTPLPVWTCHSCHANRVIGSVAEIIEKPRNTYHVMRHGEADNNILGILDSSITTTNHLTMKGRTQIETAMKQLKSLKIDLIYVSPILRTLETAKIVAPALGLDASQVIVDKRVGEYSTGVFEGKPVSELGHAHAGQDRWFWRPEGGEDYMDIKKRTGEFLYDIDSKYEGKNILIITHETPAMLLCAAAMGIDIESAKGLRKTGDFIGNAEVRKVEFSKVPHDANYELDLHRPFIDAVKLVCDCGSPMNRAKEVMDVWFDSGSMPFAQDHILGAKNEKMPYPADFISEAIDQTRGWFYTLHAIGTIMGKGAAYKNVICLGHVLDVKGKKMSKSIGNVVSPWEMMDKYGVDALRLWMYSVNQPGDSKNFDEKTVDEMVKKVFNMVENVLSFYKLYADHSISYTVSTSRNLGEGWNSSLSNVLDRWILNRLDQLIQTVTENLDAYKFLEPTRAIRDFIADLSQWYLQSSRDRFKGSATEKSEALMTLRYVLMTLSKVMAPMAPFFADHVYGEVGGELESVHLENWPTAHKIDEKLLAQMGTTRKIVEVALSLRSYKKIGVRQPLARLVYDLGVGVTNEGKVSSEKPVADISEGFRDIIKEKLNVKCVVSEKVVIASTALEPSSSDAKSKVVEKDNHLFIDSGGVRIDLDIMISPELKEEGMVRELIRMIQDLRKEKGLTLNDKVDLKIEVDDEGRKFVERNEPAIIGATSLNVILYTGVEGETQMVGDMSVKLGI